MKKIEAIIKPFKLDDVKDGLSGVGIKGSPSARSKDLDVNGGTRRSTVGQNIRWILCPKSRLRL